jgi:HSP20 family protein
MSTNILEKCLFPFLEQDEDFCPAFPNVIANTANLGVSEDELFVYITAPVPGLTSDEIEVTVEKRVLQIRGSKNAQNEDKEIKHHYKRNENYLYLLRVPGDIDEYIDPKAELKNGIMKVTFAKLKKEEAKRISITNL